MIQSRPVSANELSALRFSKWLFSDTFYAYDPHSQYWCTHDFGEPRTHVYSIWIHGVSTFGAMLTCAFTHDDYGVGEFDASLFDSLVFSPFMVGAQQNSENIALSLREISGLPVSTLARLAGVTRQAYHSWLSGSTISSANISRLNKLFSVLNYARDRRPSVSSFLSESTPAGSPMDLLEEGRDDVVLGLLALRPSTYLPTSRRPLRSLGLSLTPQQLADAKAVTSFAPPLAGAEAPPEDFFVAIGCIEFS